MLRQRLGNTVDHGRLGQGEADIGQQQSDSDYQGRDAHQEGHQDHTGDEQQQTNGDNKTVSFAVGQVPRDGTEDDGTDGTRKQNQANLADSERVNIIEHQRNEKQD